MCQSVLAHAIHFYQGQEIALLDFIRPIGLLAIGLLVVAPVRPSHEERLRDTEETFAFVFAAMRSEREKLQIGHFQCHLTTSFGMERDLECWFDHGQGKLHTRIIESRSGQEQTIRHEFARTPDSLVTRASQGEAIFVQPPHLDNPDWANTLDVRNFGLAYYTDLFSVDTRYEDTLGHYQAESPVVAERRDDGMVHLQWKLKEAGLLRDLWVDGKRGFWPTRMELRMLNDPDAPPFSTNDLQVRQEGDVWVPVRYVCRSGDEVRELDFTWKSINQEIDSGQFHYKSFDMNGVKLVSDTRLGDSIILERSKEHQLPPKRGYLPWLLTGAIGLALIVGVGVCFRFVSR